MKPIFRITKAYTRQYAVRRILHACVAVIALSITQVHAEDENELAFYGVDQSSGWDVDPRRSLMVTDQPILERFSLERVMNQLVKQSRVPGLTAKTLFNQWWDTQNPKPGLGLGPNCDSQVNELGQPVLNDFPYVCRSAADRLEGQEAYTDPFVDIDTNPAAYFPIALSNRFELAPADGANCGEYRVIYARRSGLLQARNRNLFIFEAVMPNPSPKLGLRGCRKIARFWASLSKENDIERRADRLEKFYFDGLKGLPPVIKISHYGANNKGEGRIRTNQFLEQKRFEEGNPARFWILREFKMNLECSSKKYRSCQSFTIVPEPVEDNPFGGLFSPNSTDERAPLFKEIFISQIPNLAANTIADINMEIPDIFYAADSISLNPTVDNYVAQLGTGPSDFRSKIEAKLTEIGSPLTADNIVARAQALSCAGCHKLNDNLNIGGGLIWPSSAPTREPGTADGFIHVTERFTEVVDGVTRFVISPALMNEFLPSRKKVLDDYLNNTLRHYKDKHQAIGGRRVH